MLVLFLRAGSHHSTQGSNRSSSVSVRVFHRRTAAWQAWHLPTPCLSHVSVQTGRLSAQSKTQNVVSRSTAGSGLNSSTSEPLRAFHCSSSLFSGGSFRHFLWQVCKELQSSSLSLLLLCPSSAVNKNKVRYLSARNDIFLFLNTGV